MEHSNPELEEHVGKIKDVIEESSLQINNEYEELLEKTPFKNKEFAGDAVLETLFDVAKDKLSTDDDKKVLGKLLELVKAHEHEVKNPAPMYKDVLFFPNEDNVDALCKYLKEAQHRLRICVFTITNNQIRNALLDLNDAGVKIQIITDDECMKQKGSDIEFLASKGCEVRTDDSERFHMHNKFVVVDNSFILTGSFNWTVQAAKNNQENISIIDHPFYVHEYREEFKRLWAEFSGNEVEVEAYKSRGKKRYNKKKADWHHR